MGKREVQIMARVKEECQQIKYEIEVIYKLQAQGFTLKEIAVTLAMPDARVKTIQENIRKWGDKETKTDLIGRVFDALYINQ